MNTFFMLIFPSHRYLYLLIHLIITLLFILIVFLHFKRDGWYNISLIHLESKTMTEPAIIPASVKQTATVSA